MVPREGDEAESAQSGADGATSELDAALYRRLFETAVDGIAICESITDGDGEPVDSRFAAVNSAFEEETGLDGERVKGRLLSETLPTFSGSTLARLESVALEGETIEFEQYLDELDGHYEISAVSLGGGLFATTFTDITDRKEQQQQWQLYESVLGGMEEAVVVVDEDRRIGYVNDVVLSFFDIPYEALQSRDLFDSLAEAAWDSESEKRLRGALETVLGSDGATTGETRVELSLNLPTGRIIVEITCSALQVSGEQKALLVARDVTDSKEHLKEREMMAERLNTLVSNVPVVLFGIDSEGVFTVSVGEGLAKLGLGPGEIIDESIFDLYRNHDGIISDAERALDGETVRSVNEISGLYFQTTWKPVGEDSRDGQTAVIGVARDITERRKREQQLQRTNDRLDSFASRLAHELRNPLTVMSSRLSLARETGSQEHFQHLERSLNRMERLIDDLLVLAREGTVPIETRPVNLGTVSTVCWDMIRSPDSQIRVETDTRIMVDEDRFRQLLENLFRNAVEHTGEDTTVVVGDLGDGFYVEDDGPGIPVEKREAMFERGVTDLAHGTGLGLTIVREMARTHGWSVAVTEGADGGARFEFRGVKYADDGNE